MEASLSSPLASSAPQTSPPTITMSSAARHLDGAGDDARSGLGIAQTWLAIISAWTWTAVHPNIPARKRSAGVDGAEKMALERGCLDGVGYGGDGDVDVDVGGGWSSSSGSRREGSPRRNAKWARENGQHAHGGRLPHLPANDDDVEKSAGTTDVGHTTWTKVHSFFLIMGGIVAQAKDGPQTIHYRDVVGPMGGAPTLSPEGASTTPTTAQRPQHAQGPSESTILAKDDVKLSVSVSVQHTSAQERRLPSLTPPTPAPLPPFRAPPDHEGGNRRQEQMRRPRESERPHPGALLPRPAPRARRPAAHDHDARYHGARVRPPVRHALPLLASASGGTSRTTRSAPSPCASRDYERGRRAGPPQVDHRGRADGGGLEGLRDLADDPGLSMNIQISTLHPPPPRHRHRHRHRQLVPHSDGIRRPPLHRVAWNFAFTTRLERPRGARDDDSLVWISMVVLGYCVDGWTGGRAGTGAGRGRA